MSYSFYAYKILNIVYNSYAKTVIYRVKYPILCKVDLVHIIIYIFYLKKKIGIDDFNNIVHHKVHKIYLNIFKNQKSFPCRYLKYTFVSRKCI